jgi:hypothetical protein
MGITRMKIKIFGERNTSTNALQAMIKENSSSFVHPSGLQDFPMFERNVVKAATKVGFSKARVEKLKDIIFARKPLVQQWKHCATYFDTLENCENTHFVFLIRHPASWALSLYKNPYQILTNRSNSFLQFIDSNLPTLKREMLDCKSFKPLELYQEKIISYKYFIQQLEKTSLGYTIIKFEDMILRQSWCYNKLKPFLDIPNQAFSEVRKSTKVSSKNLKYYQNYYGNELWKAELGNDFFSNFEMDRYLLDWMGYDWKTS